MQASDAPIRVAFLGIDENTADLIRAVLESRRFELVGICEFTAAKGGVAAELQPLAGHIRPIQEWEDLLDDAQIDAVVVARDDDEDRRAEQMRKFIQIGRPVLAAHPVVRSMLVYYELDMIRRETRSAVVPQLGQRHHPALRTLAELVAAGGNSPIGKVEHLSFERCLAEPARQSVERQFARDVDVVRFLAGDMTRLGAMGGAAGAGAYLSLGVQMSGPSGVAARWSVVPSAAAEGGKITLAGARGRAVLEVRGDGVPWILEQTVDGQTRVEEFAAWDSAQASLEALAAALDQTAFEPDWVDACRSVELAETIERSLQRSRTVELYYEDYTEEGTFKGTMTSLGCGLLLLGMFMLALVGVAEQMHIPYVRYWPYVLVALFGVFLFLQLAMLTKRKEATGDGAPGDAAPPGEA